MLDSSGFQGGWRPERTCAPILWRLFTAGGVHGLETWHGLLVSVQSKKDADAIKTGTKLYKNYNNF